MTQFFSHQSNFSRTRLLPIAIFLACASIASAQQGAPPKAHKYQYEVASIKRNKTGDNHVAFSVTGATLTATNVSPALMLRSAYGLSENQLETAPDWLKTERYDVQAKMEPSVAAALQKLGSNDRKAEQDSMLQALLEDRFHLKIHRDTKELPVYWLVVTKPGKIHESQGDCDASQPLPQRPEPGQPPVPVCGQFRGNFVGLSQQLVGQHVPIAMLCNVLSSHSGRQVLDKTGLTGRYDMTLEFASEQGQTPGPPVGGQPPNALPSAAQTDSNGPSLFTALQEQLGLKLDPGKGPVVIFVIDHVDRPSEN